MNPFPEERPDEATLVRNMNSLLEVSKALGAEARLDSLLGVIVRKATEVMEAERSSIFIYDEASDTLSIRISEDLARGADPDPRRRRHRGPRGPRPASR